MSKVSIVRNANILETINNAAKEFSTIFDDTKSISRLYGKSDGEAENHYEMNTKHRSEAKAGDKNARDYLVNQYAIVISENKLPSVAKQVSNIKSQIDFVNFHDNISIINFEILMNMKDIKDVVQDLKWDGVVSNDMLLEAMEHYRTDIQLFYAKPGVINSFIAFLIYAYESGNRFLEAISTHSMDIIVNNYRDIFVKGDGLLVKLEFLAFTDEESFKASILENDKTLKNIEPSKPYAVSTTEYGSRIATASYGLTPGKFTDNTVRVERILHVNDITLEDLSTKYKTTDKVVNDFLRFFVRARACMTLDGDQGTGKTTTLGALIKEIPTSYSIAVNDFKDELKAKQRNPEKDIFTLLKHDYVTYNDIFALELTMSRDIFIQAEVVKDEEITNLIDARLRLNAGTLDTIHSGSPYFVVQNMRNMAMRTGFYKNERSAEIDIAKGLDFIVFMKRDPNQKSRIIVDSIVEVLYSAEQNIPTPLIGDDFSKEEKEIRLLELNQILAYRGIKNSVYEYKDIIRFDHSKDAWKVVNKVSDDFIEKARVSLPTEEVDEFVKYMNEVWCYKDEC